MAAHFPRQPIPAMIQQHAEDAASLRNTRAFLVRAPHVKLHQLQRLDERLAAHLDGIAVGGDAGRDLCIAALETPSRGAMFAATVIALETRDGELLRKLLAVAEAEPQARSGLAAGFGWAPAASLRGVTTELLASAHPFQRDIGLSACAMHDVSPGTPLEAALAGDAPSAVAMRVAASLGQAQALPACLRAATDGAPEHRFTAARAAVLLGERDIAIRVLSALSQAPGPHRAEALTLLVKLLAPEQTHALLKSLSQDPASMRTLIRGTGATGDSHYVPWLIKQMAEPRLARLAGEAFSMITGLDLAHLDLDRKPPEGEVFGPDDDPADAEVAMDEDDGLPWPDATKIGAWWQAHGSRFKPGVRHFVGEALSPAHCLSVLKTGFQRQRIAAAEHRCLLQPGTPLFNVAAPSWRQSRLLAKMAA
jgi:uncharacterized protein (TIGR02270 family)